MSLERSNWWDGPWPCLAYLVFYPFPWIWRTPTPDVVIASIVGIVLFVPLYLAAFRSSGRRLILLSLLVICLGFVLSPLGGGWTTMSIYAALLLGRLRPLRLATVGIGLVAAATALWGLLLNQSPLTLAIAALLVVVTGMGSVSREAFYDRTIALLATQEEVRRLAGTAERERMVRDLHDVIGRTLTLIAIKSDLAGRLVTRDVAMAVREVATVGQIARDGLAEVRAALAGQLGGSLTHELQYSIEALDAASIDVRLSGELCPIPRDAGAILAMALREAVTNTIRHSQARSCMIAVSLDSLHARLAVSDDGISDGAIPDIGNGLRGMQQRLTAAGGSLALKANNPGLRVEASVPA